MRLALTLLPLAALVLLSGCYPLHAMHGHFDLMARRQPLDKVMASGYVESLAVRLKLATRMREFASRELGLPDNGSYRVYAHLDGDYPVWNAWVVPEFDIKPRESCFPVAGCVPYRGYYSRTLAEAYLAPFRESGDDTLIGGVTAYSTLGYFDDPLTSAMLRLPDERLAGLIFHELAHQVVYVKNRATFNESFARTVEIEGTLRWLAQENPQGLAAYQARLARANAFHALIRNARKQLDTLYRSDAAPDEKRRMKAEVIASLQHSQQTRKTHDPAWAEYDGWFKSPNNATLAAVATYYDDVARFRTLLAEAGGDFKVFYARVKKDASLHTQTSSSPSD